MIEDLTLKGCIDFAITTEELGSEYYLRLADKFSQVPEVAQLFARLSEDELIHKKQFEELKAKAPPEGADTRAAEMGDYLKAMSHSTFFSKYRGPFKDIDSIGDRDDALVKALEFEKATLGFYKAVEEVAEDSELLSQIIAMERSHVAIIMKALLVDGSKFRSLQDTWP